MKLDNQTFAKPDWSRYTGWRPYNVVYRSTIAGKLIMIHPWHPGDRLLKDFMAEKPDTRSVSNL
jgi:hypothetical protein